METLKASVRVDVRFNEVDSMGIVWHGNYVRYFEDARVAFGKKYGIGYLDIFANGYYAPIVNMDVKFVNPLVYGDTIVAEAVYVPCESAKMLFRYRITRESDGLLVAEGSTSQVFLGPDRKLSLYPPEFYVEWKKKNKVDR